MGARRSALAKGKKEQRIHREKRTQKQATAHSTRLPSSLPPTLDPNPQTQYSRYSVPHRLGTTLNNFNRRRTSGLEAIEERADGRSEEECRRAVGSYTQRKRAKAASQIKLSSQGPAERKREKKPTGSSPSVLSALTSTPLSTPTSCNPSPNAFSPLSPPTLIEFLDLNPPVVEFPADRTPLLLLGTKSRPPRLSSSSEVFPSVNPS